MLMQRRATRLPTVSSSLSTTLTSSTTSQSASSSTVDASSSTSTSSTSSSSSSSSTSSLDDYTNGIGGGRIIHISSIIGLQGNIGQSVYAASKSGLHGMTSSLSLELAPRGITVNCICPGYIASGGMTDRLSNNVRDAIMQRIPTGEIGRAEDVAHMVAFMAAPVARYMTGQIVAIDGGIQKKA